MIQILYHLRGDHRRVFRQPGLRGVAQDAELKRQVIAMRVDVGIDATRVVFKAHAIFWGEGFQSLAGGCAQSKDALFFVALQQIGTQDFREFSRGVAAHAVHLPETVLSGDITLGEEQVVEIGGFDGGDAVIVSNDRHRRGEAGDRERSIELRQG